MGVWIGYTQEGLAVKEADVVYYNVKQEPFTIYGFYDSQTSFQRLPEDVANRASATVATHHKAAAGGRIRFCTDSGYVAIRVRHSPYNEGATIISRQGQLGVDMYVSKNGRDVYYGSFMPPVDREEEYEGILYVKEEGVHQITLCLPYVKQIYEMQVGIQKGSTLTKHDSYKEEKPIVFYGSSITQGISASRPGNSYENFISRKLDCNYYNLGFSGSAMGETAIAEYISGLSMSAFVMDYDHNAPDKEHLEQTHRIFYEIVRTKNPELPIILLTRPDGRLNEEEQARREVIMKTFIGALEKGDKHVYFVDGYTCFPGDCRADCTVDGCHPNDLGMYFIAERLLTVLEKII